MSRGRDERGQATAEYVAVLALVAVLVGTAGVLAGPGAPGIVNAVVGQFERALCIVTGVRCASGQPEPCVVAGATDRRRLSGTIGFVRLDDDHVLIRERLSDDSFRLTFAQESGLGAELALGTRLHGVDIGSGLQLRVAALAVLGRGRVFHARDAAQARRIQKNVIRGLPLGLDRPYRLMRGLLGRKEPKPDQTYVEGGVKLLGKADAWRSAAHLQLGLLGSQVLGVRRDRRRRQTTVYLRATRSGTLLATAMFGVAVDLDGAGMLALTLDRDKRPVDLSLLASGAMSEEGQPPTATMGALLDLGDPADSPGVDLGKGQDGGAKKARSRVGSSLDLVQRENFAGRRWEVEAHLDLTRSETRAAFAAWRRAPLRLRALKELGAHMRDRARIDLRSYGTRGSRVGVGGGVASGPSFGLDAEQLSDRSRLLSASTRPPGGAWEPRLDCVAKR